MRIAGMDYGECMLFGLLGSPGRHAPAESPGSRHVALRGDA